MPFLTDALVVRSCGPIRWELLEDLVYEGHYERFVVPAGFTTDFASVPWVFTWLVPRYGVYTRAAVLHDYLCAEVRADRFAQADADGIFRRVLRELGVSFARRWMMWGAVRVGSRMAGANGKAWCQLLAVAAVAVPLLAPPMLLVQTWAWLFQGVEWLDRRLRPTKR